MNEWYSFGLLEDLLLLFSLFFFFFFFFDEKEKNCDVDSYILFVSSVGIAVVVDGWMADGVSVRTNVCVCVCVCVCVREGESK